MATPVYLEIGAKKVFACSVDWAGWCRAAKTEEAALEALAAYESRYRAVAEAADIRLPKTVAKSFDVIERITGNATTDFGAPGQIPDLDREELMKATARRLALLVAASWTVFDDVVAGAPAELRKGPRGGGRDTAKVVDHVAESETSYARSLGLKLTKASITERREAITAAIAGDQGRSWPTRYAARRIAWHVLDHAWEIEDKSE